MIVAVEFDDGDLMQRCIQDSYIIDVSDIIANMFYVSLNSSSWNCVGSIVKNMPQPFLYNLDAITHHRCVSFLYEYEETRSIIKNFINDKYLIPAQMWDIDLSIGHYKKHIRPLSRSSSSREIKTSLENLHIVISLIIVNETGDILLLLRHRQSLIHRLSIGDMRNYCIYMNDLPSMFYNEYDFYPLHSVENYIEHLNAA